ncbi:hypothetical protein B566_EDAN011408 [Ephemera danica]|nr:hypothetical protein B566_EDAN011408 [Ephemera danica]
MLEVLVSVSHFAVSTPALVGVCLGATLFLVTMAAVTCFCYRRRSPYTHKLHAKPRGSHDKPITLRRPTAVKSPGSGPTTHFLKKTPSPSGVKSPPGALRSPTGDLEAGGATGNKRRGSKSPTCAGTPQAGTPSSVAEEQCKEAPVTCSLENEKEDMEMSEKMSESGLVPCVQTPCNEGGGAEKLGQLTDKNALVVTVVQCRELPARDPNVGSSDPYVKLQLLPDKQHRVKTRVLRKTRNPLYDEDFTFFGISFNQLQSITLHFVVLSFDRYSRDDIIGEVFCPLGQVDLSLTDSHQLSLTRDIHPRSLKIRCQGRGELLVSLCWQPAASRLTVVVLKARNLPKMDVTGLADPYVKIYLLFNTQRIAKKKTHVKKRTLNPVFNESFVFEIPQGAEGLDCVSLEFMLLDWDRVTKNEVIGRLELGGAKSTGSALHHWNEVCNAPRRQIAEWHKLRE